jgi:hypothetical protein
LNSSEIREWQGKKEGLKWESRKGRQAGRQVGRDEVGGLRRVDFECSSMEVLSWASMGMWEMRK